MKSGSNQTMNISQILTKLKSLVYSKSEADTLLSAKASSSHKHTKSEITDFPIIPTKTSQLTNDSGFLTSHQSLSNYSTLANTVKSLSISGKTITVTPGSGSAYTLTTQDTTYSHPTSSGNKHIPSGGSSGQFLGWSADGTAKWVNNPNTNTWTAMVGATSSANGSVGYVNAVPPKDGYNTKYLRADGTWQVPPDHTYTVNNATLTIQKNGSNVATFTANASSNVTCNITVPTKTSELTNNSGFLTSHQSLSNYSTLANTIKSLSISGKTITYTKGDNTTGTLTTQDTNTTYSNFVKSGSGAKAGLVPAPSTTAGTTKYLREDGTWQVPPDHTYTVNNATLTIQKNGTTVKTFTANASSNVTCNITVPTKTSELTDDRNFTSCLNSTNSINFDWSSTYPNKVGIKVDKTWLGGILTTANTTIPTKTSQLTNDSGFLTSSGGAVITGDFLARTVNNSHLLLSGGKGWDYGANVSLYGKDNAENAGVCLIRVKNNKNDTTTAFYPSGSIIFGSNFAFNDDNTFRIGSTSGLYSLFRYDGVIWNNSDRFIPLNNLTMNLGGAGNTWKDCFLLNAPVVISDSRAKTQVQDVDDKLLDAWENVSPKTFKMVSAVEKKGEQARFHTGYIAQDIEKACADNNIDATRYGLFCFDSWDEQPEVTEDVEVEKDGVKTTETRIVQEKCAKGDSYSLRYEEALVVECAYLRRENSRLKENLASIEERLEKLEKAENS